MLFLYVFLFIGQALVFGELCGDRKCLDSAVCEEETCVCTETIEGDGELDCYRDNWVYGMIKNDPRSFMYYPEYPKKGVGLIAPCRYLVTTVDTELKYRIDGVREKRGSCHTVVHAWNAKNANKGKFYVGGYDLAIRIEYDDGSIGNIEATIRKTGSAANGVYSYVQYGDAASFLPDGEPLVPMEVQINRDNVQFECEEDVTNERMVLEIRQCGIRAIFRAYDYILNLNQPYTPGFAFGINCAHKPQYPTFMTDLFMDPEKPFEDRIPQALAGILTDEEYLLVRVLLQGAAQTQIDPNPHCSSSKPIIESCIITPSKLQSGLSSCKWILTEPKFVKRCDFSNSGIEVMRLFNLCVQNFCDNIPGEPMFKAELNYVVQNSCSSSNIDVADLTPWLY